MRRHIGTAIALASIVLLPRDAQLQTAPTTRQLAGTWTLVSMERPVDGGRFAALPFSRGLLVLDTAGHIFEGTHHEQPQGAPALGDRQLAFATFSGFWGTYRVDAAGRAMTVSTRAAVHPNWQSAEFARPFTVTNDPPQLSPVSGPARLTITAGANDPSPGTRWTWERVPPVENLSPAFRQVAGFWEHVVEKRINLTTGASDQTTRAPSVIVYTPSGYVGVHFPRRTAPAWRASSRRKTKLAGLCPDMLAISAH